MASREHILNEFEEMLKQLEQLEICIEREVIKKVREFDYELIKQTRQKDEKKRSSSISIGSTTT